MLTITDMTGSIDSPFGPLAFTYDSAAKRLRLGHLSPAQAMALLESIDSGEVAEVPTLHTIATDLAPPEVQTSEPKKTRQRKSRAKAKPAETEAPTNGHHVEGSAFSPTEVKMDADEEEAKPASSGIIVEEVADLNEDVEATDPGPEPDDPVPEGWERSLMDGEWQVTHIACGCHPCLCHISEGTTEAPSAEEEEPIQEAVESTNGETSSEPPDDPIFEALKKCERLVNVIPIMQEHGMTDPQELYDKCVALKPFVPCLTKISANFDERIKRAITVRTP